MNRTRCNTARQTVETMCTLNLWRAGILHTLVRVFAITKPSNLPSRYDGRFDDSEMGVTWDAGWRQETEFRRMTARHPNVPPDLTFFRPYIYIPYVYTYLAVRPNDLTTRSRDVPLVHENPT